MATLEDLIPVLQELSVDNRSVLTRIEPVILTTGKPGAGVGAVGAIAIDMTARVAYGPKASTGADPWGDGEAFAQGPTGPQGPPGPTGPQGPAGSGSGDVLGPATHASGLVPTWTGANNRTLGAGRPIGAASDTDLLDRQAGDARYVLDSGLNEKVDDRVNALIVAGTGISKTYDDVANTLTLAATGGGGGGGAAGLAGVTDWALEALLASATSAAVSKPWGFADPLASSSQLDLAVSTGETFSTGYVDNFTTPSLSVEGTPSGSTSQAFSSAVNLLPSGTEMADDVGIVTLYIRPATGTTPINVTSLTWRGAAMTQIDLQTSSAGARLYVYSYKITGSESGNASIGALWQTAEARCAINAYRIRGANPTVKVAFATSNNPPNLTGLPSGKTNLFIAAVAGSSGTASDAGAPSDYTGVVNAANFSGQTAIVSARRFVAQTSDDPGTFSSSPSGTNLVLSCTIGVEVGVGVTSEMSLVWNVFTTPVVPTAAAVWVEVEAVTGTITPNTNLMVDVSRDGGETYSTAVLKARGSPVGGVQVLADWSLPLGSQPSDNDCRFRIRTDDDAGIRIHKAGVLAG
jgi:hypothetical protein